MVVAGCTATTSDRDSSEVRKNIIPYKVNKTTLFTKNLYLGVADRASQVQLFVEKDVNFRFVQDLGADDTLTIKNGKVIENSGTITNDIFLKAGTPVIANTDSSSQTLVINAGNKLIKFSNFKVTSKNKETSGYPNNVGGVYLPQACENNRKLQQIKNVAYRLTTPCNAALLVEAKHIKTKERHVDTLKGKTYSKPKQDEDEDEN